MNKTKTATKEKYPKRKEVKGRRQGPNRAINRKKSWETWFTGTVKVMKVTFISLLGLGTLAAAVDGGYKYYQSNNFLVLKKVVCEGNRHHTPEQILDLMNIELGTKLFDLNTSESKESIQGSPWIKSVKIRRKLPSSLKVTVEEYLPMAAALFETDDLGLTWKGLSEQGEFLPEMSLMENDLPVLETSSILDEDLSKKMASFLIQAKQHYPEFYAGLSQIKYINSTDAILFTRQHNRRILINLESDFGGTLEMWRLLKRQYQKDFKNNQTIDLRISGKAYIS